MGMDLETGSINALSKEEFDRLFAKAKGLEGMINRTSLFRTNDEVDVQNRSLPSQPPMRFRIIDFDPDRNTLLLKGIPS